MVTLARDKPRNYGAEGKVGGAIEAVATDIIYEGAAVGNSSAGAP